MRRAAVLVAVSVVFSGCLVGPNYTRPPVETPAGFREAAPGESVANLPWWDLYEDPALRELIRVALAQNLDLRIAAARIEQARALAGFVRADQFPTVDGTFAGSKAKSSEQFPPFNGNQVSDWVLAGQASFEVDLWGKLRRATESARADLLATEEARRAVTINLVSDVATLYFRLLAFDAQRDVAARTLTSREQSLRLVRNRYEGGVVPELDVYQAQIQLENVAANVPSFERAVAQTENALSVLLARPPGTIARASALDAKAMPPEVPAGLPAELLTRRPDLLQAEAQLHAVTAQVGVAEAQRWPRLALTGAFGVESSDLADIFAGGSTIWSAGGGLVAPLFNAGKNKRRVPASAPGNTTRR